MMKKMLGFLLGLFLLLSLSNPAGATLITNGSFEVPVVQGAWQLFDLVPGWTGQGAKVEYQSSSLFGPAADGNQYVELDSNRADGNPYFVQFIPTVIGNRYELSFAFSARKGWAENKLDFGAGAGGPSLLHVVLPNVSGLGLIGTDWTYYSYTFVADTLSTGIGFRDYGADDGMGTFIDDVSVTRVPEPGTMFLLATGLFGLAGYGRRKFRK